MSAINELIVKQKTMNDEGAWTEAEQKAKDEPKGLAERLIAAAQEEHDNPTWESVDVVLGGEVVTIEAAKVWGEEWQELERSHPPVTHADLNSGFNRQTLPRDYPVDRLRVAGEKVNAATWQALYDVLEAPHQLSVAALLWGVNVYEVERRLGALLSERGERVSA